MEINWPKASILMTLIVVLGGLVALKILHPDALIAIVTAVMPLMPVKLTKAMAP